MEPGEIDRIFYNDGYRLANEHLSASFRSPDLMTAISRMYGSVDGLLRSFLKRTAAEGRPAACRKGCQWCCHQTVFAVTHELFYLQQYIRDQLSPERAGIFADRARFRSDITLGLSPAEQLKVKSPCPFLDDGACQVYPARPMACRIYLSSSAAECRKEFEDPRNKAIIPPLFEFPLRAGRMLNEGFVAYLRERGLPVSELPLEQAYKSMISLELTAEKWISKARD